jgi:hypothetical protein
MPFPCVFVISEGSSLRKTLFWCFSLRMRIERKGDKTKGRTSCNNFLSIQKKFINSGNAARLDRIAHPIEGVDCSWLSRLLPAPPIQEKTLTRLKYRKHFLEDWPRGDLSPPLSPECFHTLGWESFPLFQLIRVSYIFFLSFCFSFISCAFYRNVLWFTTVCLLGFFWTRAKDRVSNPGCTLSCIN